MVPVLHASGQREAVSKAGLQLSGCEWPGRLSGNGVMQSWVMR